MRIIFFTQEDPFYVKIFFDEFLRSYERLDEIKPDVFVSKLAGDVAVLDRVNAVCRDLLA